MNDRVSNKLVTQIRCKSLWLQLVYCYDPRGLFHEAVFLVKLCLLTKQSQEKLNLAVLVRVLPSGAPAFS